jgi:3-isopropylmalate dehydratase small subunit
MHLKLRGHAFVVGDWIHEREILGPTVPEVPRVSDLVPAKTDLLRRLGASMERPFESGDIIVAGRGFANGTRRDHTALLLKMRGVALVLAESVDPRFRRSATRLGLPVLTLVGLRQGVRAGDELIVSIDNGTIENLRTRRVLIATPPSVRDVALLEKSPGLDLLGIYESDAPDPDVMEVGPARTPRDT